MKLETINWPVSILGRIEIKREDTISYKEVELYDKENDQLIINKYIIDDLSYNHDTLGRRRLAMKSEDKVLYPINKVLYFLSDLIKLAHPNIWFIDNSGHLFKYQKSARAYLTCHKLKNIMPSVGMGVILEIEGIVQRFKLMFRPDDNKKYVGLLRYNNSYLLYGVYDDYFKPTHRRI